MRKTLLTLATVVVLAGLFAGSWFVTGMLRGDDESPVVSPDTSSVTNGTTIEDTIGSTGAGNDTDPATTPVSVDFPLPADLFAFETSLNALMGQFGANSFAKTRVFTYASIAWYEAASPDSAPTFVSAKAAGQGRDQAMLAAGEVVAALLKNPQVTDLIDAWEGELTPQTSAVVAEVVAFAAADGYDTTAGAEAPTFDGEFGWKPGGTKDAAPGGYEPAYGQTRTIRLDPAACPVDAAPIAVLSSEKAALSNVEKDVAAPILGEASRFSAVAFSYINLSLADDQKQQLFLQGQTLGVALHDALIATWRANWENGVAAPIDVFAAGDTDLLSSYPSYPSWTDVAASLTETYVSGVLGKKTTMDDMIDFLIENHPSEPFKDQLAFLRNDMGNAASTTHHWNVDREAGRKLGTCIAGEALKTIGK